MQLASFKLARELEKSVIYNHLVERLKCSRMTFESPLYLVYTRSYARLKGGQYQVFVLRNRGLKFNENFPCSSRFPCTIVIPRMRIHFFVIFNKKPE